MYIHFIYIHTHTPNISVAMLLFWFIVFIVGIFVIAIDVMWLCVVNICECIVCILLLGSCLKSDAREQMVPRKISRKTRYCQSWNNGKCFVNETRKNRENDEKRATERERDRKKRKVSMESIWAFRITAICTWLYRSNTNNQIGDNFWDIYLSSLKRRWTKIESEKVWFLLFNSENLSMSFRSMSTDVKQDMHRRKKQTIKLICTQKHIYIHSEFVSFS